jgi:Caspase domain
VLAPQFECLPALGQIGRLPLACPGTADVSIRRFQWGTPMRWITSFVLSIGLALLAISTQANAQKRLALVIGNSAYANAPRLENPRNDASDLGGVLKNLGFEVMSGQDLDKASMDRTIRDFAEALAGSQLGLFFYAGHGLQVNGQNYLVPVDAKLTTAVALDFEMVRLEVIQRSMERVASSNIIILDACRDNPLARNLARALGSRSAAIGRGLAPVESGEGTLISFSTQPGNIALDGVGRNSPFALALVKYFPMPGEDLPTILINVRNDVMAATDRKQVPWEHSALTAKIYFTPPKPIGPIGPTHDQQVELTFWLSVKDSTSPTVLRTYVDRYPNGEFSSLARALVQHYEQQANASVAAREEDRRRQEEQWKAAEVLRLEQERRVREIALTEERIRAEKAKNAEEKKRIEDKERAEHAAREKEIARAREEASLAKEAAQIAEEQRLAAVKAAKQATKTAEEVLAKKRESTSTTIAAMPKLETPQVNNQLVGSSFRVRQFMSWDNECKARPLPTVKIVNAPKHGKIEFRRVDSTIHEVTFGSSSSSKCIGRSVPARAAYYISFGAPIAMDQVTFEAHFASGNIGTWNCEIKPILRKAHCDR